MYFSSVEGKVWEVQFCRVGGGDGVVVREDDFHAVQGRFDVCDWEGRVYDAVEEMVRGATVGYGWSYYV